MAHPRCVGWGEMGLDYHYDNSPRDVQQKVFIRQLKLAVNLGKPLTIHTREADEDTERILKEHVPKEHKVCLFDLFDLILLMSHRCCVDTCTLLHRFPQFCTATFRLLPEPLYWDHRRDIVFDEQGHVYRRQRARRAICLVVNIG